VYLYIILSISIRITHLNIISFHRWVCWFQIKGFGVIYLGARAGAICFDPSFPEHFGMVNQVPGLAVAAMLMVGLTLRSDEK